MKLKKTLNSDFTLIYRLLIGARVNAALLTYSLITKTPLAFSLKTRIKFTI